MIARTWGGKVPLEHASWFHEHPLETGVRDLELQGGRHEIKFLRRAGDGWAHFLLFSVWQSWDSVRGYAGESPDQAALYPDAERVHLAPDLSAKHYGIGYSTGLTAAAADAMRSGFGTPRQSYDSKHLATVVGPFSHAWHSSDLSSLSGQVGHHPGTANVVDGGATAQAEQILANRGALTADLDLCADRIVKVDILPVDGAEFAAVHDVYVQHFAPPFPARTTVTVEALSSGAVVELEAVARNP